MKVGFAIAKFLGGFVLLALFFRAVFDPMFLAGFTDGSSPDALHDEDWIGLPPDVAVARHLYESNTAVAEMQRDPVVWDPPWRPAIARDGVHDNPEAYITSLEQVRSGERGDTVLLLGTWDPTLLRDVHAAGSICASALRAPRLAEGTRLEVHAGGAVIFAGAVGGPGDCEPDEATAALLRAAGER